MVPGFKDPEAIWAQRRKSLQKVEAYRKFSIKPPGGLIDFKYFRGAGEGGGLINFFKIFNS